MNKDIYITINDRPARTLMLKNKFNRHLERVRAYLLRQLAKYDNKIDFWFRTSGYWLSDDELRQLGWRG